MSSTGDFPPSPNPTPGSLRERFAAFLARRSDFAVNIAKLSSGTAVRSLISFGAIPIVTRLYEPKDFGDLQLLLSIMAPFVAVSTLKYEVAIVLPKDRIESNRVAVLCLAVVCLFTLALSLLTFFFGDFYFRLVGAEHLRAFSGLVLLGFFAASLLRTTNFMLIANKHFGALAQNSVLQVSAIQSTNIGLGLWQPSFLGLFAGQMAGYAVAILHALWRMPFRFSGTRVSQLVELASRYRKFPLVNTPGVFVNTLAYHMPVFLLARYFDASILGFYMLTDRLLMQPTALIGEAVTKVYLQSAADTHHLGGFDLRALYRRTTARLFMISAPFSIAVVAGAPAAVELVLGSTYREVGVLMQILVIGHFFNFVSSPLISTLSVVNKQEIAVVMMVASAAARLGGMLYFSASANEMLLALSLITAAFSVVYLVVIDIVLTRVARDVQGTPEAR